MDTIETCLAAFAAAARAPASEATAMSVEAIERFVGDDDESVGDKAGRLEALAAAVRRLQPAGALRTDIEDALERRISILRHPGNDDGEG